MTGSSYSAQLADAVDWLGKKVNVSDPADYGFERQELEAFVKELWERAWAARKIPLSVELRVRDSVGRERAHSYAWEAVEQRAPSSIEGTTGVSLTTAMTSADGYGARGEVIVSVGI